MSYVTPTTLARATLIAEGLTEGLTHRQIAACLGISGPRVSRIVVRDLPVLRHHPDAPPALRHYHPRARHLAIERARLDSLRAEVNALLTAIRTQLRDLDEELEAARTDELLGLRPPPTSADPNLTRSVR